MELGKSGMQVPSVALGCMRIAGLDSHRLDVLIKTALDCGINFFDHADIYAGGACEERFGETLNLRSSLREKLIIQSKCGIVPGKRYDFSKEYILRSVEGSLRRLKTDYLDVLLLHRPDALMEPEEVAAAFDELQEKGMVRHFGVSNETPTQMQLLSRSLRQPLIIDQMQFSIANAGLVEEGMHANMRRASTTADDGTLDYCRLQNITVQAWSPFQYGFFEGCFLGSEKYPELNRKIEELAARYRVSDSAIAVAWILRHPARIQTIVGTTSPERLRACAQASEITLTRQEWYDLYLAAGHDLP